MLSFNRSLFLSPSTSLQGWEPPTPSAILIKTTRKLETSSSCFSINIDTPWALLNTVLESRYEGNYRFPRPKHKRAQCFPFCTYVREIIQTIEISKKFHPCLESGFVRIKYQNAKRENVNYLSTIFREYKHVIFRICKMWNFIYMCIFKTRNMSEKFMNITIAILIFLTLSNG